MPFTSPEVFSRNDYFGSRQDVFSLGVICYKLIFNSYPFRFNQKQAEQLYRDKEYMDRLLFVPEII
jgi:serine/threonine protein kinase